MPITAAQLTANISVTGATQAKADLASVGETASATGSTFKDALGGIALAAGAAVVGVGVASVKMAGDFQAGLTSLVTGAGESRNNLKMVSDGILNLATSTGTSTKQLTDGMYMIESAGFHGSAGLSVLQAAAQGAKVGSADLGTVAGAVTTVMHDYADSNYTATQATNALITTVASGKTHMQDLSGSLSAVLPLASSLHIPFEQVAGALATMTNAGMPAQQASQNLSFAIRALNVESSKGSNALDNIGLSAEAVHNSLVNKGLPATLQLIEDHIGKQFPLSSMQGQQALKDIMGGAVGLNVALMVGGGHLKEYTSDVSSIGDALKSKSKDVQGWADVQGTFNQKLSQAQEVVETLGIKLGTALLPFVNKALDAFTNFARSFASPDFGKFADGVGKQIGIVINDIGDFINKNVVPAVNQFLAYLKSQDFKNFTQNMQFLGQQLMNFIKPAFIDMQGPVKFVFNLLVPSIQTLFNIIGTVAKGFGDILKFFKDGSGPAQVLGAILAGIAISFAAIQIGAFLATVPVLIAGFLAWAGAAGAAAIATIAASLPILAIGAVIAIVVAGIILAVTHWGDISKWLQGVWAGIPGFFGGIWAGIVGFFGGIGNWFHDRFNEAYKAITDLFGGIGNWFHDRWNDIVNGVIDFKNSVVQHFTDIQTGATNIIRNMINDIIGFFNDGVASIEDFVNLFGQGIDFVASKLGAGNPIPKITLGRIPTYADGTDSHPGGPAIVGERGRELVMLPKGASVLPNDKTEKLLSGIPGYAGGVGQALEDFASWISGGAKSILDGIMSAFNIKAPNLPGLTNLASQALTEVGNWALGFINKILPGFLSSSGGGGGGSAGPGTPVNVSGNLMSWIMSAIALTGVPASWANDLATIAMHESGGNPDAVNNWDINAQEGHPSQGIMQTIPSTFAAYMVAGHGNILNPIDNIAAAIGYIKSRYGSVFNVPGIVSMAGGGPYQGYADGTSFAPGGWSWVGERGKELMYVPRGAQITPHEKLGQSAAQPQIIVNPPGVYLDGRILVNGLMPYIADAIRYNNGTHNI